MRIFGYQPRQIRKAIAAGTAPVVPLLAVDLLDLHLTRPELGGLVAAALTGFGVVFGIKNKPATRSSTNPEPRED